ncbi:MAG: CPBP family intramembrane metalloprotease, partial [Verrucomicrobiales bacterium]|nr:CPBP family intramembrane metalloprotease [Verrucomicrobiales bacterium]
MHTTPHDENRKKRFWLTVPFLFLPFVASLFYAIFFDGTPLGTACYIGIKIFLIGWPIVATLLFLRERIRFRDRANPGQTGRSILWGSVFAIATLGLMFGLMQTPLGGLIDGYSGSIREFVEGLGVMNHFILFAVFLSLLHSSMEEFYWRWFIFGNLRQLVTPGKAMFWAAVGFASHHIVILSQFFKPEGGESNLFLAILFGACVGLGGAVWSWLYHRHGNLWGAWVSHMIIDFGIMWLGWT